MMNARFFIIAIAVFAMCVVATISFGVSSRSKAETPSLAPFEFHREGATNPEDAAKALFRGCASESPKHFVRHLLLGVCDGSIDTLQKFAECLHETKFSNGEDSYSLYDLPKRIETRGVIRVIASQAFDPQDKQVAALKFEMMSTYYGEKYTCVDVSANGYDGLEYQTRIVVAHANGGWYALPRCRSARSFYEIADAMRLPIRKSEPAK